MVRSRPMSRLRAARRHGRDVTAVEDLDAPVLDGGADATQATSSGSATHPEPADQAVSVARLTVNTPGRERPVWSRVRVSPSRPGVATRLFASRSLRTA